jgi:hypothetical protein
LRGLSKEKGRAPHLSWRRGGREEGSRGRRGARLLGAEEPDLREAELVEELQHVLAPQPARG